MVVVIDPQIAGISGDMLLCSLVNIGASQKKIIDGVYSLENFFDDSKIKKIDFSNVNKHGVNATQLILEFDEKKHERRATEILGCIKNASERIDLSDSAKQFANSSAQTLIEAEAKVHGVTVDSVHLHEASSIDTVVDIVGVAVALDELKFFQDKIVSCPVAVGGGSISFSHGTTSNPASAILEIFKNSNIVIKGGKIDQELTTPTGASMLVNLTRDCSNYYPSMKVSSIGYGAGKKDFQTFSNVLKIVKGVSSDNYQSDSIKVLETNVDDVSGEVLGSVIEKIMKNGAKDISVIPAVTKKGRPSHIISIVCDDEKFDAVLNVLISETGTLGVRVRDSDRIVVPRKYEEKTITLEGKTYIVRFKRFGKDWKQFKIESDVIKSISEDLKKSYRDTEEITKSILKEKLGLS